MGVLRKRGEMITPDYIEDDFISALETSLNRSFYYQNKFIEIRRISQSDENELGYDGILTTLVPFYIQFKRSNFYTPKFSGQLLNQRKKISLPVDKGFFGFELLKKDNRYDQHNAMFLLSQKNKSAYVAPLFHKGSDLSKFKSQSSNYLPSYYDDILIHDYRFNRRYNFRNLLLFKNAITIQPHAEINDNNPSHHYTYCRDCRIGFHSEPINLENSQSQNLNYFLQNIFREEKANDIKSRVDENFNLLPLCFNTENNSDEYVKILELSIKRVSTVDDDSNVKSIIEELDTLDKLLIIEDILYSYFNIRQFIKYETN